MAKRAKNKVWARECCKHAFPRRKKSESKSVLPLNDARRRALVKAMQVRSAPFLQPDSMRRTAMMPYPVHRMDGPKDALNVQIGYLAIHLRFLEWTKKCTRERLAELVLHDESLEQPFVYLVGRIVDVRYYDDWDPSSSVSRICLMAPHAYNEETDMMEYIDSHIWVCTKKMRLMPDFPLEASSLHIGDAIAILGEVVPYSSDPDMEGRRYGIGRWTLLAAQFDYIMNGKVAFLSDRAWLGASAAKISTGGNGQKCRFARQQALKGELASLRRRAIDRKPLKCLIKEEDLEIMTLEEGVKRYMAQEEAEQRNHITIEANRAMRRKLDLA